MEQKYKELGDKVKYLDTQIELLKQLEHKLEKLKEVENWRNVRIRFDPHFDEVLLQSITPVLKGIVENYFEACIREKKQTINKLHEEII